jgi:spermidine synthase
VKPTERLGTATAPDGSVMTLYRRDGAYMIVVNNVELMSTRRVHSEQQLAVRACAPLVDAVAPSVLIGGLGLGATLRTALEVLPVDAEVTMVELMREVLEWNQNPEFGLAHVELRDARVTTVRDDVRNVLAQRAGAYDAIMMDVDNGAESFTTGSNKSLYGEKGVRSAINALRPNGRIIYWSVDDEPAFVKLLQRLGLCVTVERVRAHATSGGYNVLIIGERSA